MSANEGGPPEPSGPDGSRMLQDDHDLEHVVFDERGLVPVIAQDVADGTVLMMAWANRDALGRSLDTGELHFWSRSRQRLWRKGETSGNVLRLVSLHRDCDGDTVLARVRPAGPACHTGTRTCFGAGTESSPEPDALGRLQEVLEQRARERPAGSYTTRLLADDNLRLKKLGEETGELIAALARGNREAATEEAADLVYHVLVALSGVGVGLDDVRRVLASRMH